MKSIYAAQVTLSPIEDDLESDSSSDLSGRQSDPRHPLRKVFESIVTLKQAVGSLLENEPHTAEMAKLAALMEFEELFFQYNLAQSDDSPEVKALAEKALQEKALELEGVDYPPSDRKRINGILALLEKNEQPLAQTDAPAPTGL